MEPKVFRHTDRRLSNRAFRSRGTDTPIAGVQSSALHLQQRERKEETEAAEPAMYVPSVQQLTKSKLSCIPRGCFGGSARYCVRRMLSKCRDVPEKKGSSQLLQACGYGGGSHPAGAPLGDALFFIAGDSALLARRSSDEPEKHRTRTKCPNSFDQSVSAKRQPVACPHLSPLSAGLSRHPHFLPRRVRRTTSRPSCLLRLLLNKSPPSCRRSASMAWR